MKANALNESVIISEKRLNQIYLGSKILFIVLSIVAIFDISNANDLYSSLRTPVGFINSNFVVRVWGNIALDILFGIFLPLQSYFFYKFIQKYRVGKLEEDSLKINTSLDWLLKYIVSEIFLFAIQAIWGIYSFLFLK